MSFSIKITDHLGNTKNFDVTNETTIKDIFIMVGISVPIKINAVINTYEYTNLPNDLTIHSFNMLDVNTKIRIEDIRITIKKLILELVDATTTNDIPNYNRLKEEINNIIKNFDNNIIYKIYIE